MAISDSQYNECCDHLYKMFADLIVDSTRGGYEFVFVVNSAQVNERIFTPLKPIFKGVSYGAEVTSVTFSFKDISNDSLLLTVKGLDAAYQNIPRKFARYILAESPAVSSYEREHLNDCIKQAAVAVQEVPIDEIKRIIQQRIEEYQSVFFHSNTYSEKNAVLCKMNQLYNTTRNANALSQFLQDRLQTPSVVEAPSKLSARRVVPKEHLAPVTDEKIVVAQSNTKPHFRIASVSFSSLFGIFIGLGLLLWLIFTSSDADKIFFNINQLLFVLGGTFACTLVSYHSLYIGRALKEIVQIYIPTHVSPKLLLHDVETLLKWSQKIRAHQQEKKSFRAIEEQLSYHKDPDEAFTKTALCYLLENYGSEKLSIILSNLVNTMFERSQVSMRIINSMGDMSFAFGIIGTLVSVIIALSNPYYQLSDFMNSLAVSFIPTLYGLILTFLIFKPASRKLEQKNEMRRFRNQLLSRGLVLIAEDCSTLEIQDNLNSFLDPDRHFDIASKN